MSRIPTWYLDGRKIYKLSPGVRFRAVLIQVALAVNRVSALKSFIYMTKKLQHVVLIFSQNIDLPRQKHQFETRRALRL